jgi:transcription elongation factor GreA
VAKRLHEFWLADEPVLYISRSAKQIGARVAAMNATQLGDARPHSGGHWLKTLSVLNDMRVWWAETDAHEEYEDALLAEIASRNLGTAPVLPFANLVAPDGTHKPHGLLHSLRSEAADAAGASSRQSATAARRKPPTRKPAAPKTTGPRKSPTRTAAPGKPQDPPTMLSAEGLEKLTAELEDLRTVQRPQIIARVAAARELGDLRENADYEYARKEQSFLEGRVQMLEQMLRTGVVIEHDEAADVVHLGSTVDLDTDGESVTYVIVGSTEANPAAGRLSNASPVGRALIGGKAGDDVTVELPSGPVRYRIMSVR